MKITQLARALGLSKVSLFVLSSCLVLGLSACGPKEEAVDLGEGQTEPASEPVVPEQSPLESVADVTRPEVLAELGPASHSIAFGTASFSQQGDRVEVMGELQGMNPGRHRLVIYTNSRCSGDFEDLGEVFQLGQALDGEPLAGRLTTFEVEDDGLVQVQAMAEGLSLLRGPNSILGRALVVEEVENDLPVACGVVGGEVAAVALESQADVEMGDDLLKDLNRREDEDGHALH